MSENGEKKEMGYRYFTRFELKNVRTFRSGTHLDFCFPDGKLAQWTVLIGENGTGKTTLLQHLALMQPMPRPELDKTQSPQFAPAGVDQGLFGWHILNLPRPWSDPALVEVKLGLSGGSWSLRTANLEKGNPPNTPIQFDYSLKISLGGVPKVVWNCKASTISNLDQEVFILGYGANRHVAGAASPYLTNNDFSQISSKSQIYTLFYDDQPLISPEQWILGLDHAAKTEGPEQPLAKHRLAQAKECLINILPDVLDVEIAGFSVQPSSIESRMSVIFKTPFGDVPFGGLSLGYKTMAAWLIDFVNKMYIRHGKLENPEHGPAIVLIDEFDLHMHPTWQVTIMDFLSKRFPNTQFIVTAHSPLIVQAAGDEANVALLKRVRSKSGMDEIAIENNPVHIKGWRIDQLLTSDLYGLESTRSTEYQELFKRQVALLRKANLTEKEEKELDALTLRLDKEAPPGEPDDDVMEIQGFKKLPKRAKISHGKA